MRQHDGWIGPDRGGRGGGEGRTGKARQTSVRMRERESETGCESASESGRESDSESERESERKTVSKGVRVNNVG